MAAHNPEQERFNQIREATRMGDEPDAPQRTLHLRNPRPAQNRHPVSRSAGAPRAKHTPKGHDAKLKAWQAEARVVSVITIFGLGDGVDSIVGAIIESDRYTITVRNSSGEHLVYKHAIAAITPHAEAKTVMQ